MAVAEHWMLHYLNVVMEQHLSKRDEEARLFATFDTDFAIRHAGALTALCARADLEYFAIDCAETRDGDLLIFEADTAMVVHDMDPPALYPNKGPQMQKVFRAFRGMLGVRRRPRAPRGLARRSVQGRSHSEIGGIQDRRGPRRYRDGACLHR